MRETADWGRIVFNLVDHEMLRRQDTDSIEDFDDGYDFDEAFVASYTPALPVELDAAPRPPIGLGGALARRRGRRLSSARCPDLPSSLHPRPMLERLSKNNRNIALVAIGLLLGWFAWKVRAVLNPLILGYLLAYILRPLVARLEDRGMRRRKAVNIIFALFGAMLVLLLGGVFVQGRQFVGAQIELAERGEDPFTRAEQNPTRSSVAWAPSGRSASATRSRRPRGPCPSRRLRRGSSRRALWSRVRRSRPVQEAARTERQVRGPRGPRPTRLQRRASVARSGGGGVGPGRRRGQR